MNKPPFQTMMLGHGLVVLPAAAATIGMMGVWMQHPDAWWLAIITLILMGRIMKAHEACRDYLQWKRQWDAMDPHGPPPRRWPMMLGVIAVAIITLIGAGHDQIGLGLTVGGLIGGGLLVVTVPPLLKGLFGMRLRRARRTAPVRVIVPQWMRQAPTVASSYAALPPHCRAMLDAAR